jgi:hypothetical protein
LDSFKHPQELSIRAPISTTLTKLITFFCIVRIVRIVFFSPFIQIGFFSAKLSANSEEDFLSFFIFAYLWFLAPVPILSSALDRTYCATCVTFKHGNAPLLRNFCIGALANRTDHIRLDILLNSRLNQAARDFTLQNNSVPYLLARCPYLSQEKGQHVRTIPVDHSENVTKVPQYGFFSFIHNIYLWNFESGT